nr:hypothetical protein [Nocardia macrotermitis]
MEIIATGADLDDFDPGLSHARDGPLAQHPPDPLAALIPAHAQHVYLAVSSIRITVPRNVSDDLATFFGHRDVPAFRRAEQPRNHPPIVLVPGVVLVFENLGSNHRPEGLFIEGTENLDRNINGRNKIGLRAHSYTHVAVFR